MKKIAYQLEFMIHASPQMLFAHLKTPEGLSEWFADDVTKKGNEYTFQWEDYEETAMLLKDKIDKSVTFQWEADYDTPYSFQIEIVRDDITQDITLVVSDFATEDELAESKMFWEGKIAALKHCIGSE